jgi:hypothetical protein
METAQPSDWLHSYSCFSCNSDGVLTETGLRRTVDGGLNASWALSWPEQRAAGVPPIVLQAYFGAVFTTLIFEGRQFKSKRPVGTVLMP